MLVNQSESVQKPPDQSTMTLTFTFRMAALKVFFPAPATVIVMTSVLGDRSNNSHVGVNNILTLRRGKGLALVH